MEKLLLQLPHTQCLEIQLHTCLVFILSNVPASITVLIFMAIFHLQSQFWKANKQRKENQSCVD